MWVYNNSAYLNNYNYGFTTAYGTNTIQNCLSYKSQNADAYKAKNVVTIDHNSWNGFTVKDADFLSLDTTLILAPRNGNGDLPVNDFMRLADNSALIDAGIDVNLGYKGDAPDLGCYEADGEEHQPEPEDTIPAVQPEGTHSIAFVTIPGCAEDKPLLKHLRANDSLWIVETEAADPNVDYSAYELIVLGSKPASSAAGFTPLKDLNKPKVLLKPWLLKPGVWSWGTAINTADLSVAINDASHPLFRDLNVTDGQITLFEQCNTNAVTAISEWTFDDDVQTLGTPVSTPAASSIAILSNDIILIGVSEYSTAYLTLDGKKLIENAICLLLGIPNPHPQGIENHPSAIFNKKFIHNGQLFIQTGDAVYSIDGRRVIR